MMEHTDHNPGTVRGCKDCARQAYEPGWYAAMLSLIGTNVTLDLTPSPRPVQVFAASH
jgi:hypothetical protein